jgi:cytochrome c553
MCGLLSLPTWADDSPLETEQRVGTGDPVAGQRKSKTENCQECHGEHGISTAIAVPKLAGQYADYLVKQLQNFQSGARKHPVMNVMAEGLSESDLCDIAAYFASQPFPKSEGTGNTAPALAIFQRGDLKRNIPACKSCHGDTARGKLSGYDSFPALAGQHKIYLREQLRNWRKEARTNSPNGMMNVVAQPLTDAEIEALADYLSGL